jgi:hypothetical protein
MVASLASPGRTIESPLTMLSSTLCSCCDRPVHSGQPSGTSVRPPGLRVVLHAPRGHLRCASSHAQSVEMIVPRHQPLGLEHRLVGGPADSAGPVRPRLPRVGRQRRAHPRARLRWCRHRGLVGRTAGRSANARPASWGDLGEGPAGPRPGALSRNRVAAARTPATEYGRGCPRSTRASSSERWNRRGRRDLARATVADRPRIPALNACPSWSFSDAQSLSRCRTGEAR